MTRTLIIHMATIKIKSYEKIIIADMDRGRMIRDARKLAEKYRQRPKYETIIEAVET